MAQKGSDFPSEIAEQVKEFHLKLINLKKELEPIINNLYKIRDDVSKDPIKTATLELTMCQAINSLFYMYLQTTGIDARTHSIGHELYRIEKYMLRLGAIKDKALRPKLNQKAASAFVRSAMFDLDSKNECDDHNETDEKPAKRLKTE